MWRSLITLVKNFIRSNNTPALVELGHEVSGVDNF
jgi:hypothetical protein